MAVANRNVTFRDNKWKGSFVPRLIYSAGLPIPFYQMLHNATLNYVTLAKKIEKLSAIPGLHFYTSKL